VYQTSSFSKLAHLSFTLKPELSWDLRWNKITSIQSTMTHFVRRIIYLNLQLKTEREFLITFFGKTVNSWYKLGSGHSLWPTCMPPERKTPTFDTCLISQFSKHPFQVYTIPNCQLLSHSSNVGGPLLSKYKTCCNFRTVPNRIIQSWYCQISPVLV